MSCSCQVAGGAVAGLAGYAVYAEQLLKEPSEVEQMVVDSGITKLLDDQDTQARLITLCITGGVGLFLLVLGLVGFCGVLSRNTCMLITVGANCIEKL